MAIGRMRKNLNLKFMNLRIEMKTLKLKLIGPCWYPEDHDFFQIMFRHFSGGNIAVTEAGLAELIVVAGEHGWSVETERK